LSSRAAPEPAKKKEEPQPFLDAYADVCNIAYMAETIRIDPASHAALSEIARAKRIALSEALARAVESYRRELMLQAMAADYADLRSNPEAWANERAERAAWDKTIADGLEDE
jgi:hypothetical protein